MKETLVRALSGAVYVGVVVSLAFIPAIWSVIFFLIIAMVAAREYGQLFWQRSNGRLETVVYSSAALYTALAAPVALGSISIWQAMLIPLVIFLITLMVILKNSSNVRSALAGLSLGVFLIGTSFGLLTHLQQAGYQVFLGIFILLWANDTFAYLWGRMLGKRKLIPRISPKKTVEGLLGGVFSALLTALVLSKYWQDLTTVQWLFCSLLISLSGTLGDLLESALKRQRGVKDSGNIMPGHGGILDRFDGMLLAAPTYFILLKALAVI